MRCQHVQKKLPLFAHQDLPADEQAQLTAHVRTCEACRAMLSEYQKLVALTQESEAATPPAHFFSELQAGVFRQISGSRPHGVAQRGPGWRKQRPLAFALAGLALLVLAGIFWPISDDSTRVANRSLESYLRHGDYRTLWNELHKPQEKQRLLRDSVSVDVLIDTIEKYPALRKKYGRFRTASAVFVPRLVPEDMLTGLPRVLNSVKLSAVPPASVRHLKKTLSKMAQQRKKITPAELVSQLKKTHLLFRR